ncbi:hypothetical protein KCP71_21660 [Salmonella enterica subsp. enterica]|nr:hypothetical protein KCP71_21660 [Salmonella enterica subsp. enterica]
MFKSIKKSARQQRRGVNPQLIQSGGQLHSADASQPARAGGISRRIEALIVPVKKRWPAELPEGMGLMLRTAGVREIRRSVAVGFKLPPETHRKPFQKAAESRPRVLIHQGQRHRTRVSRLSASGYR